MITDEYLKKYLQGTPEQYLAFLEEKAQELQEESDIPEEEARRRVAAIALYHLRSEYFFMEQLQWYREQLDALVADWINQLAKMGENPATANIPLKAVDRETARDMVMTMLRHYISGSFPAWIVSYVQAKNQSPQFFGFIENWAGMNGFPNDFAREYVHGEWPIMSPDHPPF